MLQDMLKFTHTPIRMPQVTGIHMEDEIKLTDSDWVLRIYEINEKLLKPCTLFSQYFEIYDS